MNDRAAENLGVCRVVFFAFALLHYGRIEYVDWAGPTDVFWRPILLFRMLHIARPSYEVLLALQWIFRASALLSCVGLYTRASVLVAGISGAFLIALPNNFSNVKHLDAAFTLTLVVMALTRCGDAFSVDAVRAARRGAPPPVVWRFEYQWPVAVIRTMLALDFCAAGFAKLRRQGVDWIFSDSLQIHLSEHLRLLSEPLLPAVTAWLIAHPLLCSMIAGGTVGVELLYPLTLFWRRARWVFVPGVVLLLLSIRAFQGPAFYPLAAVQLFWVNWPWVFDKLGWKRGRYTVG